MQRHDVGRAHEVERRRLERRNERWIRGIRELTEELLVEPAEEVDRLRLRHPERPGVPRGEAREAPCAEHAPRGRRRSAPRTPLRRARRPPSARGRQADASGRAAVAPRRRRRRARRTVRSDRGERERDAESQLDRQGDADERDAEHVAEPGGRTSSYRRSPSEQGREEPSVPTTEQHRVEDREPEERSNAHGTPRWIETPAPPSHTTSAGRSSAGGIAAVADDPVRVVRRAARHEERARELIDVRLRQLRRSLDVRPRNEAIGRRPRGSARGPGTARACRRRGCSRRRTHGRRSSASR